MSKNHKISILLFLIVFTFILTPTAYAVEVAIEWSESPESDIKGYKVFIREEAQVYDYNNPDWEGGEAYCEFTLDNSTQYYFVIRAVDISNLESEDSDEISFLNNPNNERPIADAGATQTVGGGDIVELNGSGSYDPDGTIETYQWIQTDGESVSLSSEVLPQIEFTAPLVGSQGESLIFELTVTDNEGSYSIDTVIVNVTDSNVSPTAVVGVDQAVDSNTMVLLDASGSYDSDGSISTYRWVQTSGSILVDITGSDTSRASFIAPDITRGEEVYKFNVRVTDNEGLIDEDDIAIYIRATFQDDPEGPSDDPDEPGDSGDTTPSTTTSGVSAGGAEGGGGCFITNIYLRKIN